MKRLAALLLVVAVATPVALAGTAPAFGLSESPDRPTSDEVVGNAPNGFAACASPTPDGAIVITEDRGCDEASTESFSLDGWTEGCFIDAPTKCLGASWDDDQFVFPSTCLEYEIEMYNYTGYTLAYWDITLAGPSGEELRVHYDENVRNGTDAVFTVKYCAEDLVYGSGPYQLQQWYSFDGIEFGYDYDLVEFRDGFKDVADRRAFATEITWLTDAGITNGYSDGTYRPLDSVNRDAMAAFLYRFAGSPAYTPPSTSPFRDINRLSPFYKEITWLADTGITGGYSDGTFRPGASVNRDAMAAFLYRYAEWWDGQPLNWQAPSSTALKDINRSTPFYREITWLANTGITGGYSDGTFRAGQAVARDAMAAFLYRFDRLGY